MKFTDQLGREIELEKTPQRIVSLVPSQTELLFDLGLNEEVVGITKFCIHPKEQWRKKTRIGGTKTVDFDKVRALRPDLIIANKEENTQSDIESLQKEFPVWISDIYDLPDAIDMISSLGELLDKSMAAQSMAARINHDWQNVKGIAKGKEVVYLIWNGPIMSVGPNTFIDAVLDWVGCCNKVTTPRYPELTEADLIALDPELLMLSSEPFPFKQKHLDRFREILPNSTIQLVDGELFSWYGSRLLKSPKYLADLFALS